MTHHFIEDIISKYSLTHLICDSSYPLITNSTLDEEAMLYNITKEDIPLLCDLFLSITGKTINTTFDISTLSGGQKVVLMTLLALLSPADKIIFVGLATALDTGRSTALAAFISQYKPMKSEILQV